MIKKLKVLTIKSELSSAKGLGFETFVNDPPIEREVTILRWGNGGYGEEIYKDVFNRSEAIHLNVRKFSASQVMSKVVSVPNVYLEELPKGITAIRRPFNHTRGEGYKVIKGPADIPYGYYCSEAIKTKKEYRVWFTPNSEMCARRVPIEPKHIKQYDFRFPCRSEWAYSFLDYVPLKLYEDVERAKKAIGLDFGAADVLEAGGKYYFLELNSAPSIDCPRILRFFKRALCEYT